MHTPKNTFWAADGIYYGRVDTFATSQDFLRRIYRLTPKEDEDNAFFKDWKERNPLEQFVAEETPRVKADWYRWSFVEGGELCLDSTLPKLRGAFLLWVWRERES